LLDALRGLKQLGIENGKGGLAAAPLPATPRLALSTPRRALPGRTAPRHASPLRTTCRTLPDRAIPCLVEIGEAPVVGYADLSSSFDTQFSSTWSA